jgi:dTDP-4-dehydrorhamnose reductase
VRYPSRPSDGPPVTPSGDPATWFVTGAGGLLGAAFCTALRSAGHRVVASRRVHPVPDGVSAVDVDLAAPFDADRVLDAAGATHVLHAAALTDVDACETRRLEAYRLHVQAAGRLAAAANRRGSHFVMISTDQLWRELSGGPASECLPPDPVNVYGATKAAGEVRTLDVHPGALVVRTNFFGASTPWRHSASDRILSVLATGDHYPGFADVWFTPIGLPLLCRYLLSAVERDARGVLHLGGGERISKLGFARLVARHHGYPEHLIEARSLSAAALPASRPLDMSLDSAGAARLLGTLLPSVQDSIDAVYGRVRDPCYPSSESRIA